MWCAGDKWRVVAERIGTTNLAEVWPEEEAEFTCKMLKIDCASPEDTEASLADRQVARRRVKPCTTTIGVQDHGTPFFSRREVICVSCVVCVCDGPGPGLAPVGVLRVACCVR